MTEKHKLAQATKKKVAKRKVGRPTLYSKDLGNKICFRLADGESMNAICKDKEMPARYTVIRWSLDQDHEFSDKYAIARKIQAELLADEIFDISDDVEEDVNRSRLKVDSRKWYLSRIVPRFKDKQDENHAGITVVLSGIDAEV